MSALDQKRTLRIELQCLSSKVSMKSWKVKAHFRTNATDRCYRRCRQLISLSSTHWLEVVKKMLLADSRAPHLSVISAYQYDFGPEHAPQCVVLAAKMVPKRRRNVQPNYVIEHGAYGAVKVLPLVTKRTVARAE